MLQRESFLVCEFIAPFGFWRITAGKSWFSLKLWGRFFWQGKKCDARNLTVKLQLKANHLYHHWRQLPRQSWTLSLVYLEIKLTMWLVSTNVTLQENIPLLSVKSSSQFLFHRRAQGALYCNTQVVAATSPWKHLTSEFQLLCCPFTPEGSIYCY